jgi:hypothetical protein
MSTTYPDAATGVKGKGKEGAERRGLYRQEMGRYITYRRRLLTLLQKILANRI